MRSKVFILSGPFGGGKTETAVSFIVPGKEQTVRLVVDPEIRADTYQSPDGIDHQRGKSNKAGCESGLSFRRRHTDDHSRTH